MGRPDLETQIVAFVLAPKCREEWWQEIQPRRSRGAQAHPTDGPAGDLCHSLVRTVDGAENPPRLLEENLARHRQRHAPGGPIEELRAKLLLEQGDLVRHGG